jgi:hypothetical protein
LGNELSFKFKVTLITLSTLGKHANDATNLFFRHELGAEMKISITNPQIILPPLVSLSSWAGSKVVVISNPDRDDLRVYA